MTIDQCVIACVQCIMMRDQCIIICDQMIDNWNSILCAEGGENLDDQVFQPATHHLRGTTKRHQREFLSGTCRHIVTNNHNINVTSQKEVRESD